MGVHHRFSRLVFAAAITATAVSVAGVSGHRAAAHGRGHPPTYASPAAESMPPRLLFTDAPSGPNAGGVNGNGAPLAIYGLGFGTSRGRVTIGGVEVAAYLEWGSGNAANPRLDRIVVEPGSAVTGGDVVVHTAAGKSTGVAFDILPGVVRVVTTGGSDVGECLSSAPCATLGFVSARMSPGDTTLVRGGEYVEGEWWLRAEYGGSGTPTARKRFMAYPGERPVFTNAARPFIIDADDVTIEGFDFRNGKSLGLGYDVPARARNWVIDSTFEGLLGYEATGSHGDGHLFAGNVCRATGSTVGTQGHCFYISYGRGVKLLYNDASGAPGYGIHVFDQRRQANDFRRMITDLTVEGNVLSGSTRRSGLILAMGDEDGLGNSITRVVVRDNLFTGNNHLGMVVGDNVTGVVVVENTFRLNGNAGLYIGAGARDVTVTANLFDERPNDVCKIECSWYEPSHVLVAAGGDARLNGNHFLQPVDVVGAVDPSSTTGSTVPPGVGGVWSGAAPAATITSIDSSARALLPARREGPR